MQRPLFKTLGALFVVIGLIGVVVPLLPTTIFLILAATCFARSSPELERRIMEHRRFGPPVRAWREHGVISRRSKAFALAGMGIGFSIFLLSAHPGRMSAFLVALFFLGCAAFVVSRPSEIS
ncbi:YbaN family protein [Stappia sp. F7233]|uniref:YbaN family protein n=1 Tax=Stappia albiluteola TaxID=2758565 RepID=A0A839ACF2_9HYPH|nr:YbaN family protein [Stappia albiluteola]MBA5776557.1 YbaN family protein [Stappia albiluteola]